VQGVAEIQSGWPWGIEPTFDGVATFLSVVVAVLAFSFGFWQNQIAKKQQLTLQVMLELLTVEKFSDANVRLMKYVESNKVVDPGKLIALEDNLFMSLLSMYEFISINFLTKQMDRKIILKQRKSGLAKTYEVLKDFIYHKREIWDRPHAYRSFETLVTGYILPEYSKLVNEEIEVQEKFAGSRGRENAQAPAPAARDNAGVGGA
jgi:hypothetical protein